MPKIKMEDLPLHLDRHYLLYAKNHYEMFKEDGTIWGDLKKIHAHYYAVDDKYITNRDITYCLLSVTMKIVDPIDWITFLSDIDPENCWRVMFQKDVNAYDFNEAIVSKCLSLLRFISVYDKDGNAIANLGKPDPSILKPSKKEN